MATPTRGAPSLDLRTPHSDAPLPQVLRSEAVTVSQTAKRPALRFSAVQSGNGGSSPHIADATRFARAVPTLSAEMDGLPMVALSVLR